MLQVEAVISGIKIAIDRLAAAAIEAVAGIEIAIAGAVAEEEFVGLIKVGAGIADDFGLPQAVGVADVVIQGEISERNISAVIQRDALIGWNGLVGADDGVLTNLLKVALEAGSFVGNLCLRER